MKDENIPIKKLKPVKSEFQYLKQLDKIQTVIIIIFVLIVQDIKEIIDKRTNRINKPISERYKYLYGETLSPKSKFNQQRLKVGKLNPKDFIKWKQNLVVEIERGPPNQEEGSGEV